MGGHAKGNYNEQEREILRKAHRDMITLYTYDSNTKEFLDLSEQEDYRLE